MVNINTPPLMLRLPAAVLCLGEAELRLRAVSPVWVPPGHRPRAILQANPDPRAARQVSTS